MVAWFAAKITGGPEVAQLPSPPSLGEASRPGQGPGDVVEHHGPGEAHGIADVTTSVS